MVVGLLLAVFVLQGYRVAALPAAKSASWGVVIDDGFYYLQVARNIARGEGPTFDRVHRTSGFQPLWTAMLVPIFWFTDDADKGLQAALALSTALGALALLLLYLGLRRLAGVAPALLASALMVANPYFSQILQGGLETPALFACLAGVLAWWAYRGDAVLAGERRACVGLGVAVGLTILARVDVALILAPLGLALCAWPAPTWRQRLQRALWVALPCAGLLLPYVLFNLLTQGHFVPSSGLVKKWVTSHYTGTWELFRATEQWRGVTRTIQFLAWPRTMQEPGLDHIGRYMAVPAGLALLLGLRLIWSRAARRNRAAALLLGTAAAGVAGHFAYMFWVYRCARYWDYHYFFPFAVLASVLLAVTAPLLLSDLWPLVRRLIGQGRHGVAVGVAVVLCGVAMGALLQQGVTASQLRYAKISRPPQQSFRFCRYQAGVHVRNNFPRQATFGSWWAGIVGYFSDRRVVNLDGVINSAQFFERYLRTERVPQYLRAGPVTHLMDFFWRDPLHPASHPCARTKWWECEKEHVVRKLRPQLTRAHFVPHRGGAGVYILKIKK